MKLGLDFKQEPVLAVLNLILYITLLVAIYFLFLKVTGNSPVFETIITTLVVGLIINTFRYEFTLGKLAGSQEEFRRNVERSFANMKEDLNEVKTLLHKKR
ncbi:MAG: hypothetical protein AABX13_02525 [Nanoarchaeota archaeon]